MRRCVTCGAEFHPKTRDITCSPECREVQRKQYHRDYHRQHADIRCARAREWVQDHPDHTRKYQREYESSRKANDPRFAMDSYLSKALNQAIRRGVRGRWVALTGYGPDELRNRIETTFTEGMSWANYGEWEIDHIRPKVSFTYNDAESPQFAECWSLTNLRARWSEENRRDNSLRRAS